MTNQNTCQCTTAPTLIFACSGSADVGEISDLAARQLARDGIGRMFCLAGVGGRIPDMIEATQSAHRILAINGCLRRCTSETLTQAGITDFIPLDLAALGLDKGRAPANPQNIAHVAAAARALIAV